MTWVWTSNQNDVLCDGLEGGSDEEPVRPHPNCDCSYHWSDIRTDCFHIDIESLMVETSPDGIIEITVDWAIHCKDDTEISGSESETRQVDDLSESWSEAVSFMEEVRDRLVSQAESDCECDEPSLV